MLSARQRMMIEEAARVIREGGVVAYPTETVYGFGCDPRNAKALKKLYALKAREKGKSVLWIAGNLAQVMRVAQMNTQAKRLAKKYWPGPLSMILPRRDGKGTIGVRVSSSPFARALALRVGHPIVSTSANVSGESPCRSGKAILRRFQHRSHKPDMICDVGSLPRRTPSTLVRVHDDGVIEVLRRGAIRL